MSDEPDESTASEEENNEDLTEEIDSVEPDVEGESESESEVEEEKEEPEEYAPLEEPEFQDDEIPEIIREETAEMIEMFTALNADITNVFASQDAETEEVISMGFQFRYNQEPGQFINPLDERYTSLFTDYDLLYDMIVSSEHPILGGDFQQVPQEEISSYIQSTRSALNAPQVYAIIQNNRVTDMPTLESSVYAIGAGTSIPVEPQFQRINHEFLAFGLEHKMWSNIGSLTLDELYNKLCTILNAHQGLRTVIASSYLINGIQIPNDINDYEDYDNLEDMVQTSATHQSDGANARPTPGFQ